MENRLSESINDKFRKTKVCTRIDSKTNYEIIKKIDAKFKNAEEYLKIDKDFIIGKIIDKEKFKNPNTIKSYNLIGTHENIFPVIKPISQILSNLNSPIRKHQRTSMINLTDNMCNNSINNSIKKNYDNLTNKISLIKKVLNMDSRNNIEFISDQQLENIFFDKKTMTEETEKKKRSNFEIIKNVDSDCKTEMKNILSKQEKALDSKNEYDKQVNNLSKFISKKTKKTEKELLMNKTDGFRLKNQCIQRIQSSNPVKLYKYGILNEWKFNLRVNDNHLVKHRKNHESAKKDYILTQLDIREKNCDIGAVINLGNGNFHTEHIIKPNSASLRDFRKYANSRAISSKLRNLNINCEELINVNNLNVNGENLLNVEIEMAKNLHGRKMILKDNQKNNTINEEILKSYNKTQLMKNKP